MKTTATKESDKETIRIAQPLDYNALQSLQDGTDNNITQLLAQLLDAPVTLISQEDSENLWCKSEQGLQPKDINQELDRCSLVFVQEVPLLLEASDSEALIVADTANMHELNCCSTNSQKKYVSEQLGSIRIRAFKFNDKP